MRCIRWVAALLAGISALFAVGCMSNPVTAVRVVPLVKQPKLVVNSKVSRSWGYLSHPYLQTYQDVIVLTYNTAGDVPVGSQFHPVDELRNAGPSFSADNGQTWVIATNTVGQDMLTSVRGMRGKINTHSGTYYYPFEPWRRRNKASWMDNDGTITSSTNVLCDFGTNKLWYFFPSHYGVELPSGMLLVAGEFTRKVGTQWWVGLMASEDKGQSWYYYATVATAAEAPWGNEFPVGFEGPSEPSLLLLPDGSLTCVMRIGVKQKNKYEPARGAMRMLQAWSEDEGRSWTYRCLPFEGVRPQLRLLSNGVIAMSFGRPGNNLIFSTDEGHSWGREIALTPADARTSGYCDILEVEPGRLLAVYDVYNTDMKGIWLWEPKEVNGIFRVFVDVKRIW